MNNFGTIFLHIFLKIFSSTVTAPFTKQPGRVIPDPSDCLRPPGQVFPSSTAEDSPLYIFVAKMDTISPVANCSLAAAIQTSRTTTEIPLCTRQPGINGLWCEDHGGFELKLIKKNRIPFNRIIKYVCCAMRKFC